MKISRPIGLVAAAALVIGTQLTAAPPASAAKKFDLGPVGSGASNGCSQGRQTRGNAYVTLDGDYVTIKDLCADGHAVQGRVTMKVNGKTKTYSCTNRGGNGTTKVCDFDWVEGFAGFKTIAFYDSDGSGWTLGQLRHWRDG